MKNLNWLIICLVAVLTGCATVPTVKKPDWVVKGAGAFNEPNKIYGVGVYGKTPNKAAQLEGAKTRARAEIATTLSTNVQKLVRDFMEEHRDWFNLNDTAGSDEFLSVVTKQVTEQTLVGCKQVDSWEDPTTGDLYVLFVLDLGNNLYNSYKQSLRRVISEQHRAVVAERVNEALKELDKEIEKQRQREKEILGY